MEKVGKRPKEDPVEWRPKMASHPCVIDPIFQPRFSVSLIFGPDALDEEGVPGGKMLPLSSSIADMGGLVANGDGTAAGNPNDERLLPPTGGPRLNPRFVNPGAVGGGGLVAEAEGVRGGGTVPLLNSAQRGHLRFVSRG